MSKMCHVKSPLIVTPLSAGPSIVTGWAMMTGASTVMVSPASSGAKRMTSPPVAWPTAHRSDPARCAARGGDGDDVADGEVRHGGDGDSGCRRLIGTGRERTGRDQGEEARHARLRRPRARFVARIAIRALDSLGIVVISVSRN
jgi:hypothetical protein